MNATLKPGPASVAALLERENQQETRSEWWDSPYPNAQFAAVNVSSGQRGNTSIIKPSRYPAASRRQPA